MAYMECQEGFFCPPVLDLNYVNHKLSLLGLEPHSPRIADEDIEATLTPSWKCQFEAHLKQHGMVIVHDAKNSQPTAITHKGAQSVATARPLASLGIVWNPDSNGNGSQDKIFHRKRSRTLSEESTLSMNSWRMPLKRKRVFASTKKGRRLVRQRRRTI